MIDGDPKMLIDRFWEKVSVNGETGCWDWIAFKDKRGYGRLSAGSESRLAHRISYQLHRGSIPDKLFVCHHCDTPGCVNPDHLFLGTDADNVADMISKGRQASKDQTTHRGIDHGGSKLTELEIIAIRTSIGSSQRSLAKQYGVGQSQIQRIKAGASWSHIDTGANQGTFGSIR